jgi:type I restriction enzyme M protein
MPRGPAKKAKSEDTNQSLESKLWATADKLRGHLDAADYKQVVLGLIFLKYISDRFAQRHAEIVREEAGTYAAEDRDEYTAEGVFWVPLAGRGDRVQAAAKQPDIGKRIDDAMTEIERENLHLKNILPKGYARPTLDQRRLGELVDLIGTIGLGTAEHQARDTLGRVYEYFLGMFASAEGKRGGEFYTPASEPWSPCWPPTRVASMTPVVGPAACSYNLKSSSKPMAARWAISASMGKNPTPTPGSWPS